VRAGVTVWGSSSTWASASPVPLVCCGVARVPPPLIEFPADDAERARHFWTELLGAELRARDASDGEGWETSSEDLRLGVHVRGRGPGDSFSLAYFPVSDLGLALERVRALGGSVVHPGERWAICKDSEGSPFGLSQSTPEG
jgi:predicted enzyme related to lactoylglutathione lyase